jgi:hypothetical protein
LSVNASFFESGDQRAPKRKVAPFFVTWRAGPPPSEGTTQYSISPVLSEM